MKSGIAITSSGERNMIKRLDHMVLTVANIDETCNFYQQLLKLEVITFNGDRKALKVGNQKINLHKAGCELSPCAHRPTPGAADLCFIVETSLNDLLSHLSACGVPVELGPVERTGVFGPMTSLYVRDPDKNLVELSSYQNEQADDDN